ncbi:MAG: hypothetical protein HY231_24935 [Acidobacteria bacterium]|nr:hypothetical protein [Acidobacteriota bacterium]
MNEKNKELVASNLTMAFYAGLEPRIPYFGEERRTVPYSPMEDDRIPSLSVEEVFHVYTRFLRLLEESEE